MGIFDIFRRSAASRPAYQASVGDTGYFTGLNDPAFYEFIRSGGGALTESGATVTVKTAMKNTTVLRCVSLISGAIGMLPLHLTHKTDKTKATKHPLYAVLHRKPNAWQTALEFRSLMQQRALVHGDAFARIVWSGGRVMQLVPIDPACVQVKQRDDWTVEYRISRGDNGPIILPQRDVFHLRHALSEDGITGMSLVKQAAEAIGLALQAERAAARLFRNGMIVGGVLKHPGRLSPEAFERLKSSLMDDSGAENAHRWKILEEGMDIVVPAQSGRDSQAIENRRHQIEEIARSFGVPRPLLAMDDTSWGSGIDVLGQMFVRYALNPWFEAWQQAIERDLLSDADAELYEAKFNPGGLLRGNMKDQAEFFAKSLGAGGHQPWMEWSEVREIMDLPALDEAPPPPPGLMGKDSANDSSQTA